MSDVPTQGPDLEASMAGTGDAPPADAAAESDAPAPDTDMVPVNSPPADAGTESESDPGSDPAADVPAPDPDVVPGNSPPADVDTAADAPVPDADVVTGDSPLADTDTPVPDTPAADTDASASDTDTDTDTPAPGGRSRNRGRRQRNRNRNRNRQRRPDPIVPIPPDLSATREFTGALTEIIPGIGLTALGYADTGPMAVAMARAMLGRRWADEFARITVHTPRQGTGQPGSGQQGANQLESYTALIPAPLISDHRLSRGVTVAVKLTGIDVSDRRRDWYCDELRVVE